MGVSAEALMYISKEENPENTVASQTPKIQISGNSMNLS